MPDRTPAARAAGTVHSACVTASALPRSPAGCRDLTGPPCPTSSQDRRYPGAPGTFVERRTAEPDTELLSPATQIVGDKDAYLGNAPSDIGRRIADDQLELFVVCHPAEAMLQQFSQLAPDFIAIHDIGTTSSARLLAAVAAASSRKLQKLVIRRQGYGVALATLQFVELPLQPGRTLRVYTTEIDADTQTRHQLAQVLLAHSRLARGDGRRAAAACAGQQPAAAARRHRHRALAEPADAAGAAGVRRRRCPRRPPRWPGHSGVMVRTTPQVGRPADAWAFISGAWNRLNSNARRDAPAARTDPGCRAAPRRADASCADFAPPPIGRRPMRRPSRWR